MIIKDQMRPSWSDWNNYLKKYIPKMPLENRQDVAPEYGYIFDKLRQKYGIYISIIPKVDTNMEDSGELVFRFMGRLIKLQDINEVFKEVTISGFSYSSVAKIMTNIAIELIKNGEITSEIKDMDEVIYEQLVGEIEKLKNEQAVFNIDKNFPLEQGNYYTPENAKTIIPRDIRKLGLIIVYKSSPTKNTSEQFVGESVDDIEWFKEDNWNSIVSSSSGINNIVKLSQEEYDNLPEHDDNVLYIIL